MADTDTLIETGREALETGDWAAARDAFEAAVGADETPEDVDARRRHHRPPRRSSRSPTSPRLTPVPSVNARATRAPARRRSLTSAFDAGGRGNAAGPGLPRPTMSPTGRSCSGVGSGMLRPAVARMSVLKARVVLHVAECKPVRAVYPASRPQFAQVTSSSSPFHSTRSILYPLHVSTHLPQRGRPSARIACDLQLVGAGMRVLPELSEPHSVLPSVLRSH